MHFARIAIIVRKLVLATIAALTMGIGVLAPMASVLAAGPGETPILSSALSRKVHGAAGTFDLPLALTPANPTTEPRLGPSQTLVFVFDKPVTSGTVLVTEGTATVGAVAFSGNEMVVPLTGVTNLQYVTVAVTNVAAADGGTGGSGAVRVGFLAGDVSRNRAVTLSDLGQVNAQIAQSVTGSNFLLDVNVSGTLSLADKGFTNTFVTKVLEAVPPLANTPPQVNAGTNQTVTLPAGANLTGSGNDDGLPGPPLTFAWTKVSGPGTVTFGTPNAATTSATFSAAGVYVLRLTNSDGVLSNSDDVSITVGAAANAFGLSITLPQSGAALLGVSTLVVGASSGPPGTAVLVNGRAACVTGQTFFANDVALTNTVGTIVADALAPTGAAAQASVAVTPPTTLAGLRIVSANECGGVAPFQAVFNISVVGILSSSIQQIEADLDGDGITDIVSTDLTEPITFTYPQVKTYIARFVLREKSGVTHEVHRYVQTQDGNAAQQPFQDLMSSLKLALGTGNISQALSLFSGDAQDRYEKVFNELAPTLGTEVLTWSAMQPVLIGGKYSEFVITKSVAGITTSFSVVFVKDKNGSWKINSL